MHTTNISNTHIMQCIYNAHTQCNTCNPFTRNVIYIYVVHIQGNIYIIHTHKLYIMHAYNVIYIYI